MSPRTRTCLAQCSCGCGKTILRSEKELSLGRQHWYTRECRDRWKFRTKRIPERESWKEEIVIFCAGVLNERSGGMISRNLVVAQFLALNPACPLPERTIRKVISEYMIARGFALLNPIQHKNRIWLIPADPARAEGVEA